MYVETIKVGILEKIKVLYLICLSGDFGIVY